MKSNVVNLCVLALAHGALANDPVKPLPESEQEFVPYENRGGAKYIVASQMDACHKADSRQKNGPDYPCISKAKIEFACKANGTTPEHLKAQQDCMCGEGSSFFQDAKACSSCKVGYGLQGTAEGPFWKKFFDRLETTYCKAKELDGNFFSYYQRNGPGDGYPVGRGPHNPTDNKYGPIGVVSVREYYPDAPAVQGPGKFTPVPASQLQFKSLTGGSVPVDGPCAVEGKIQAQPVAKENATAPTRPKATIGKFTNSTQSVNVQDYSVLLSAKCDCIFSNQSVDSFKLVCGEDRAVKGSLKPIKEMEKKEQKQKLSQLPDVSNCGCFSKLAVKVVPADVATGKAALPNSEQATTPISPGSSYPPYGGNDRTQQTQSNNAGDSVPNSKLDAGSVHHDNKQGAGAVPNSKQDSCSVHNNKQDAGSVHHDNKQGAGSVPNSKQDSCSVHNNKQDAGSVYYDNTQGAGSVPNSKQDAGSVHHDNKQGAGAVPNGKQDVVSVPNGKQDAGSVPNTKENTSSVPNSKQGAGSVHHGNKQDAGSVHGNKQNDQLTNGEQPSSPHGNNACQKQAQSIEECRKMANPNNAEEQRWCLCNTVNVFNLAYQCAKEKGLDCQQAEYWRLYYTEFKYRFCDAKEHDNYEAAYRAHNNIWEGRLSLTSV
ncbi:hypothetical protein QQS21_004376 [Conoideocrella luteorostrata]|uniref:Uncharacterized protein n=1 Tax=Conoideocrella luteorostrata TaxID=1105319 RepID=A0AAJ0CRF8_9HYPO|nr:hypothetical protein QQS21_004376 [Conoideocrella luteorostrata]